MYPYMAFVWNKDSPDASVHALRLISRFRQSAPRWKCCAETAGLCVFDIPSRFSTLRRYSLPDQQGVILGRLFAADFAQFAPGREHELTSAQTQLLLRTDGQSLRDEYWGSYVGFATSRTDPGAIVIRDCSGKIPCYWTKNHDVNIFFSDVRDLSALQIDPPTIDWEYVSAFLCASQMQIRKSGLREVREVLAGEAVIFSRNTARQVIVWDPADASRADRVIANPEEAARVIKEIAQSCTSAWASVHRKILLSLSGGFDSASVLGMLMRAPTRPEIVCLNRYGTGHGEDERPYARLAARRAGVELVEAPWETARSELDEKLLEFPRLAKPDVSSIYTALDVDFLNELAGQHHFQSVWTGQAGDHLFIAARTQLGVADCLLRRESIKSVSRSIRDAYRLTGNSFWHIAGSTARVLLTRDAWMDVAELRANNVFASELSLPPNLQQYVDHPYVQNLRNIPPGKKFQIQQLGELLNRQRPILGLHFEDEHHALISQPLITSALRVPLDILVCGGRPRGLARRAFKDFVPPEIATRELKGLTTSYTLGVFRKSQKFIRALLMDGMLAEHRILDRSKIDRILGGAGPIKDADFFPLFASIAGEIWARSWKTTQHLRQSAFAV